MSTVNIGKVIYNRLTNNSDVTDLVGSSPSRIYPLQAEQGDDFPYIVYTPTDNDPTVEKDNASVIDVYTFEIDIYTKDYDELFVLANAVRDSFDRVEGTFEGIAVDKINYQDEDIDYDDSVQINRCTQEYEIRVQTAATVPTKDLSITWDFGTGDTDITLTIDEDSAGTYSADNIGSGDTNVASVVYQINGSGSAAFDFTVVDTDTLKATITKDTGGSVAKFKTTGLQ